MFQDYKSKINELEGNNFLQIVIVKWYWNLRMMRQKSIFFISMIQIHIAHLKMLEEQQLVSKEDAKKIGQAIKHIRFTLITKQEITILNLKIYFSVLKII